MTKVGIIVGSVRPGRNGAAVAQWVYDLAAESIPGALKDAIDSDFENGTEFTPADLHKGKVKVVVDQVLAWNDAMRTRRRA